MKRADLERLLISFLIAVGIFAVLGVIAGFIDWKGEPLPEYSGPMYVSLGDLSAENPPQQTDSMLVQPSQDQLPENERSGSENPGTAAPEIVSQTNGTPGKKSLEASPASSRANTTGKGTGAKVPSSEADAGKPVAGKTLENAEQPDESVQQNPENIKRPPSGTENVSQGGETKEKGDSGILSDLSGLDKALAQAQTEQQAGETGSSSAAAADTQPSEIGTPGSPVEIDQLKVRRKALETPMPQIDPELTKNLPRVIKVVISFTLQPNGLIRDLNFEQDSGNTEINEKIRNTILKWKFEPVPESAGTVKVRLLLKIDTKNR